MKEGSLQSSYCVTERAEERRAEFRESMASGSTSQWSRPEFRVLMTNVSTSSRKQMCDRMLMREELSPESQWPMRGQRRG